MSNINNNYLSQIANFSEALKKLSFKKDVAHVLVKTINDLFQINFISFIEENESHLQVLTQIGSKESIKHIQDTFKSDLSKRIYSWVMDLNQIVSIKLSGENFTFVPIVNIFSIPEKRFGMLVLHLKSDSLSDDKTFKFILELLVNLAIINLTKETNKQNLHSSQYLLSERKKEIETAIELEKTVSNSNITQNLLFSVIEDKDAFLNGNMWWMDEIGSETSLVFMSKTFLSGLPASLINGYILGTLTELKNDRNICFNPCEILSVLNKKLNPFYKKDGVIVNAWCGVFNTKSRNVTFSNANYTNPYLIGPEQQVSSLTLNSGEKGQSLGINLSSIYKESNMFIASGSRLVIFTQGMIEDTSRLGNKYDYSWLPQLLETVSSLSLPEMKNSLENLLSESPCGTAKKSSRLALLLEIPKQI